MQIRGRRFWLSTCLAVGILLIEIESKAIAQDVVSEKVQAEINLGFSSFLKNVAGYVNLHKSMEATLPAMKSTDVPELITAHQLALARKIREARPNAKLGDIFTKDAQTAFEVTVRSAFQGTEGQKARNTIRQGAPVSKIQLKVNQEYPDGVPFTTVPPTLLLKLPRLPDQVSYRIVGHDFILLDTTANLVVDRIPDIVP